MNLPANLQQEAHRWASYQGISLEQFIFQTIVEKINQLNQQVQEPLEEELAIYYEGRILVVDAPLPSDFDIVDFIDDMRSERIQELMP